MTCLKICLYVLLFRCDDQAAHAYGLMKKKKTPGYHHNLYTGSSA